MNFMGEHVNAHGHEPSQNPVRDIVLLSTADWDNPFWTNKQHVAVALATSGQRVLYIDSLGLRRPSVTSKDFKRILRRLLKSCLPPRPVRPGLWVWSPLVLPLHKYAFIRWLNSKILQAGLSLWMAKLGLHRDIFWTYNPLSLEFFNLGKFSQRIYHCVDEIKSQPGMPSAVLAQGDEALSKNVDIVFVTSPALARSRKIWNPNTIYLPNVADFGHFSKALDSQTKIPNDLAAIPGKILGFIGAISGYKVDIGLICHVAKMLPECSVVLIGSVGEGDPWTKAGRLREHNNIILLGPKPYAQLPAYLKGFDVALLPNMLNDYTESMFPMKFFEYLAAGLPVVATALDALQEFSEHVFITNNSAEFVTAIQSALCGDGAGLSARLALARQFTYQGRTQKMLEIINALPLAVTPA